MPDFYDALLMVDIYVDIYVKFGTEEERDAFVEGCDYGLFCANLDNRKWVYRSDLNNLKYDDETIAEIKQKFKEKKDDRHAN